MNQVNDTIYFREPMSNTVQSGVVQLINQYQRVSSESGSRTTDISYCVLMEKGFITITNHAYLISEQEFSDYNLANQLEEEIYTMQERIRELRNS